MVNLTKMSAHRANARDGLGDPMPLTSQHWAEIHEDEREAVLLDQLERFHGLYLSDAIYRRLRNNDCDLMSIALVDMVSVEPVL